jgi:hypothetical protein
MRRRPTDLVLCPLLALIVTLTRGSAVRAEWVERPDAPQRVYLTGVPHTDRNGKPLTTFDPRESFLPIALYHALHGDYPGGKYRLANYAKAGFNAVHLWEGSDLDAASKAARDAGVQLVVHNPSDAFVAAHKDDPAVLAWYLDEEPTGRYWGEQMQGRFDAFVKNRERLRAIDPTRPVFALDVPWVTPPATQWWVKWNTAGDVSAHDNYPINQHRQSLSFDQGIPEVVSLAVSSNKQAKPVWVCLHAFEQNDQRFNFNMPTPAQLRGMTYASLVHGATGVMYFALDSWVTRNGSCVGIAPNPAATYGKDLVATARQLRASRELWESAVTLNAELRELRSALLSPTADVPYTVSTDGAWPSVSPNPIRTLLKRHPDGGMVLLLVNLDNAPMPVRVALPGHAFEQMFESAGAGRFKATDDGFELMAGPYDAVVLRVTARQ